MLLAVVEELQNIVANDDARLATQNIQGTHPCASRSESDGFVGITVECLYEFLGECLHEYAEDGCKKSAICRGRKFSTAHAERLLFVEATSESCRSRR